MPFKWPSLFWHFTETRGETHLLIRLSLCVAECVCWRQTNRDRWLQRETHCGKETGDGIRENSWREESLTWEWNRQNEMRSHAGLTLWLKNKMLVNHNSKLPLLVVLKNKMCNNLIYIHAGKGIPGHVKLLWEMVSVFLITMTTE